MGTRGAEGKHQGRTSFMHTRRVITDHIQAITTHYGVSERLQGMMCTEPVSPEPKPTPLPSKRASQSFTAVPSFHHEVDDTESALKHMSEPDKSRESASFKSLTFAQVADQIWHFSSVDHGPRCEYSTLDLSIGYLMFHQTHVSAIIHYL